MSDKLQPILESQAIGIFRAHCRTNLQEENCGLFVIREGFLTFVPCDNQAYDRKNSFLIHPTDFVRCTENGSVVAVGHSHVTVSAKPSSEDIVNAENCRLPFVIYQPITDETQFYEPTGVRPSLIGRQWKLGVSDCYTLVRDYFLQHDVLLRDYVRNDVTCLTTHSIFLDHYAENGFVDVTGKPAQEHDLLLIQVLADVPNHGAVLVDDDRILHHLQGRLSCHDPYGGYWRRHTAKILRHEKWL